MKRYPPGSNSSTAAISNTPPIIVQLAGRAKARTGCPVLRAFLLCLTASKSPGTPNNVSETHLRAVSAVALLKVPNKLFDRGETHDTFGHLRLDRTVAEQRISLLLDHASF